MAEAAAAGPAATGDRIRSLDIIRGAVMVLMALDHTRVFFHQIGYSPTDLQRTNVVTFLTRWTTHFCAPAFVFLAGTGAFLYGRRVARRGDLAWFLVTRGVWLIVIEMTVVRLGWTFNFDYTHYVLGGVLWMIGWCMVLLAGLAALPPSAVGALGLAVIFGHNLLDFVLPAALSDLRDSGWFWLVQILYVGGLVPIGDTSARLAVLFAVVPWLGVMAAGYGFGPVMTMPRKRRDRLCVSIGLAATVLFLVLRAGNVYGDPDPWSSQASGTFTVLSFLNTTKYPASLLFLLMTLGPTIAVIPLLDRAPKLFDLLAVFGRVPFFFYIIHLPLIHLVAVLVSYLRFGEVINWLLLNHPVGMTEPAPIEWGHRLGGVYAVTAAVVVTLYLPCRWFAEVKRRRREWWVRFL